MADEQRCDDPTQLLPGFAALQQALKPLIDFISFITRPETAIAFRQALENLERCWREEEQAFIDFAVRHRWLGLERHLTSEQLRLLIRISDTSGPAAANEIMPKIFRPETVESMVTGWSTIPYLQARSQIVTDAAAGYRSGMYSLLIPALLPLAEGLAYETVGRGRQKFDAVQRAATARKKLVSADDEAWFDAIMKFLDDVYSWVDFGQAPPAGSFHRGHILHGQSPDYATAENAVRAFLLLDTVAEFWRQFNKESAALRIGEAVSVTQADAGRGSTS